MSKLPELKRSLFTVHRLLQFTERPSLLPSPQLSRCLCPQHGVKVSFNDGPRLHFFRILTPWPAWNLPYVCILSFGLVVLQRLAFFLFSALYVGVDILNVLLPQSVHQCLHARPLLDVFRSFVPSSSCFSLCFVWSYLPLISYSISSAFHGAFIRGFLMLFNGKSEL